MMGWVWMRLPMKEVGQGQILGKHYLYREEEEAGKTDVDQPEEERATVAQEGETIKKKDMAYKACRQAKDNLN